MLAAAILLSAIFVVCLFLKPYWERRQLFSELQKSGHIEFVDADMKRPAHTPFVVRGDGWHRQYFGLDDLSPSDQLIQLNFDGNELPENLLQQLLMRFPEIQRLNLVNVRLSEVEVAQLKRLSNLQDISLHDVDCQSLQVKKWISLSDLKSFEVMGTQLPPQDIEELIAGTSQLNQFMLYDAGIDEEWVKDFRPSGSIDIKDLRIFRNPAQTDFLSKIAPHTTIKSLGLSEMNDNTVNVLRQIQGLTDLSLTGPAERCQSIPSLSELKLQKIFIDLDDAGLAPEIVNTLLANPELKRLRVMVPPPLRTNLTPQTDPKRLNFLNETGITKSFYDLQRQFEKSQ